MERVRKSMVERPGAAGRGGSEPGPGMQWCHMHLSTPNLRPDRPGPQRICRLWAWRWTPRLCAQEAEARLDDGQSAQLEQLRFEMEDLLERLGYQLSHLEQARGSRAAGACAGRIATALWQMQFCTL